ncbi:Uma2 family endonuclease [Kovacikia minuta CCNUW1]|uniref:Uma2 family endonuclease n=1 Tax=Kovacikia minuta TaxID=2931930 RepID=UPI001CCF2BB8|nr:Uma2 family endonuclease [Kovacikia minuta]UBF27724.1 Uma2 family endonuclease [Kovacikia minuta CCNUW1]
MTVLTLHLHPTLDLTDEQFYELCQNNRDLRLERNAQGELIIMAPVGGEGGYRSGRSTQQLFNWADTNDLGFAFDASTGFKLPNGADRSPDAAWVRRERWNTLTPEQKRRFPPLCPDFVIELRSETASLETLRAKMREYMENGARLGWLIDPKTRQVEVYRVGKPVEVLSNPETLSGENVLPEFTLNLKSIFERIA